MPVQSDPLGKGSVSLRLYRHDDLDAGEALAEMLAQARQASVAGFDGVMVSEHHAGFPGYFPNPLQLAGWALESMGGGWAAACPLLLPLRPAALVAEEVAWLAARHPGQVGLGVAAGALAGDFEVSGAEWDDRVERFADGLEVVAGILSGRDPGVLAGDPAAQALASRPVPLVSAAASPSAARRAARAGAGILCDSLATPARTRRIVDAYHDAGGDGACVLVRRVWVGEAPRAEVDRQVRTYRSYAGASAQAHWGDDELIAARDPAEVAGRLSQVARDAGADALNLRVHSAGTPPGEARSQIAVLGSEVLPRLRRG